MTSGNSERTLVLIKPDGVERGLVGEIVKRYEQTGLKLVGLKMFIPTAEMVQRHYTLDPEWIKKVGEKAIQAYKAKGEAPPLEDPMAVGGTVLQTLKKYLSAGPVVAMVWQGMNAVGVVRKITGITEPLAADIGTIRGDFTIDSYGAADTSGRAVRNLVHASGSPAEAEQEIALWFKDGELLKYRLVSEEILYDVNLDGLLE